MLKRLGDITKVRTGYRFRGKVEPSSTPNVSVIQMKDISAERTIHFDDLVRVSLLNPEPYLVDQGDVLFLSRGSHPYAVVVEQALSATVATGFYFIVTPDLRYISSQFLTWSLNQARFRRALKDQLQGTVVPVISREAFVNSQIEVPSPAIQQDILRLYSLLNRERELSEQLLARRSELIDAAAKQLLKTLDGNHDKQN